MSKGNIAIWAFSTQNGVKREKRRKIDYSQVGA
jgi:hypothetical protein